MKSLLTGIVFLFGASLLYAQDTPPKAPGDVGAGDFDSFKTNSFNIMNESIKTDNDVVHLDNEVKSYSGVIASAQLDKLKKDYTAINDLSKTKKNLLDRVGQLDDQGKQMLESAKSFTPKMKSPAVVSNVKKSIDALDFSRKRLTNSGTLLKSNAEILTKELKSRGEKVDDFVE